MKITIDLNDSKDIELGLELLQAHRVTRTPQKSTNGGKEDSEVKEEVKTPQKATESSITLAVLKDSCKNAVTRTSRDDVKNTISEFAPKLSDVKEDDYGKLYKKLQQLGK